MTPCYKVIISTKGNISHVICTSSCASFKTIGDRWFGSCVRWTLQTALLRDKSMIIIDLQSSPSSQGSLLSAQPTACPWTSFGGGGAQVEACECLAGRSCWLWTPDAASPPGCRPSGLLFVFCLCSSGLLLSSRGHSRGAHSREADIRRGIF